MASDLFGEFCFSELQKTSQKYNGGGYVVWKKERRMLYQIIEGDAFFPLKIWPRNVIRMFWCKPMRDKEAFAFFMFFVGNGGSPIIAAEWIISSLFGRSEKEIKKRLYQLCWINDNRRKKEHSWFYYNLVHRRHFYLSGDIKLTRN